ncbi:MAG: hypothetical protein U1F63_08035 [Chitinivorax sp.]|jgi:hypothetical protein
MGLDIKGLWHKVRALASSEIGAAAPMDSNGKLLSDLQAAEFLQPFLLHKNAAQWLASDRQQNPVISFLLINGQPFYAQDDLLEFIDRLVKPAKVYFINGVPAGIDRRTGMERRSGSDRRASAEIRLQEAMERRADVKPDRRLRGELDRRGKLTAA